MNVQLILIASILFQLISAIFALRLIPITGKRMVWSLIATAISLMVIRRCITLIHWISGSSLLPPPDLSAELVALFTSALMMVGMIKIAPLFLAMKRSEKVLRQSEARFRDIAFSMADWIWEMDNNWVYTYCSVKVTDILGYSAEELIGKTALDLMPPDEAKRMEKISSEIASEKKPMIDLENWKLHKDGRRVYLSTSGVPILDEQGRLIGYRGVGKDITARKRAEQAIREREQQYHALFEDSHSVMLLIDPESGAIVDANQAACSFYGYTKEELTKKKSTDINTLPKEEVFQVLEKLKSKQRHCIYLRHRIASGIIRDVEIFSGPITVRGKALLYSIIHDITERKQAEESLRYATRALKTLSRCNEALVHAPTEEQLLSQICQLIVEIGGYRLAWVGYAEADEAKSVRPVAQFGYDEGYLDGLNLTWADTQRGQGLTGTAIRSGKLSLARNIREEASLEPWCDLALERGYASTIALPLLAGNKAFGVLRIYAPETNAFDDDEVHLLQDLANNLAFGIMALHDAAERKRAEQAVMTERAFLQTVIDGVVDPIMVIGLDYGVVKMNRAAHAYLPERSPDGGKLLCHQISHHCDQPCSGENHPCPLEDVRKTGKPVTVIHQHVFGNGEKRFYELEASPLWNEDGTLQGIIEVSRDITERKRAEAKLRENESRLNFLAHHDPLTNLPNRLLFIDRLLQAKAKARRLDQRVALLFLDLDRFKNINDSLGHEIGDRLLREVAERLRICVRESDTVARLGGDEFVVILEQIEDIKDIVAVAQKILNSLSQAITLDGYQLYATTSIGISVYPSDSEDVEGLMKCADVAMYRAKDQGRNNYQVYTPDMNACAHELLLLENNLRTALAQEQLALNYQPQFDIVSGRLIGMEALLRWQHPEQGLIPPSDFIPLAEETGLIVPIGDWVLHTACTQNKVWQESGHTPIRVAVNISARQFRQPDLVQKVAQVLEETGLEPRFLELEITESMIMNNVESAISTMEELNRMGVQLAIDDFGSGYSSLNCLKRFPISKLKIDQSFVHDITTNPNDAAIAASVIALARGMNLEVIAEGVETEEQLRFLQERGCDQCQGYLFSRPLPAEELAGLLTALSVSSRH